MTIKKFMHHYVSVLLVLVLAGCGGGGGDANTSSATAIEGLYSGSLASKEFLSVVTPDKYWYGLHFRTASNPDIYSGQLDVSTNGAATTSSSGLRAFLSGNLRSGTASLAGASLRSYSGTLNLVELPSLVAQTLNVSLAAPSQNTFQYSTAAQISDIQGAWSGIWSDGLSVFGTIESPKLINISTAGTTGNVTLTNRIFGDTCSTTITLTPRADVSIYTLVISIADSTSCRRPDTVLNGVAIVYASPITGEKRLDLIAIDSTGSGVSFRGDR